MAEVSQGPGRPPVAHDEKKVPFSASIRRSSASIFEIVTLITGEQKGAVLERLASAEFVRIAKAILDARKRLQADLDQFGFGPTQVEENEVESGDQFATVFITPHFTIHATERALYHLGLNPNEFNNANIGKLLNEMRRFGTRLGRLDLINNALRLGADESVEQSLETLKNKRVRMWIVGDNDPYVGQLTDFVQAVQLGAIMGGPSERNGTGLIPKGNVLRVEPWDPATKKILYSCHLAGLPGVKPSFTINIDADSMTWESFPAGNDIDEPITMLFSRGGPIGSSKTFTVFPGGRAQLARNQ